MDDGRITVSPYDTAWVALIRDIEGHDEEYFLAYDRLLNTLACVVALTYWNVHTHQAEKGISTWNDLQLDKQMCVGE